MTIQEIYQKMGNLNIANQRTMSEDYMELVFLKKDIKKWEQLLKEIFGPAAKPYKKKPSGEHKKTTSPFGGIRWDQTLYEKDFGTHTIIAMLWPWQDRINITLKMPLIRK